jgi:branched-chain amino acid transport system permease protein
VGAVVGGIASISGALYGAAFIQFIPNITDYLSKAAPWAIYGIILILFMRVVPEGIAGFVRRISSAKLWMAKPSKGLPLARALQRFARGGWWDA